MKLVRLHGCRTVVGELYCSYYHRIPSEEWPTRCSKLLSVLVLTDERTMPTDEATPCVGAQQCDFTSRPDIRVCTPEYKNRCRLRLLTQSVDDGRSDQWRAQHF